jgi:hypothetical protein
MLLALLVLGVVGCDAKAPTLLADTARMIGVTEPPPLPSRTTNVVVDPTLQSPVTPERIGEVLDRALADIADRPVPSCVVIWRIGATVSDLERIGDACVSPPLANTMSQRHAEEQFIASARDRLLPLATRALDHRPRQSPIAASLTRIAWTRPITAETIYLLLSDGREESPEVARLECGPLPTPAAFLASLHREELLEPQSLHGVDVRFCFFGFSDANRPGCATSVRREFELRELWRTALDRASARSVAFETGAPSLRREVQQ